MIGSVLDKYEILQKIGDGGMATVYRGRHVTLGRDVAIKVLHPHLSASPRNRQRFAREARAIEHLDHDNILKIFDYSGTDTEDCFIVTEFVDGVTLQQIVADRGRVPSEVAAIIGIELAHALSYAHDLGIIHRDLKPENVMVRRDGTVKLMDFGIARFLDEVNLTMTGALVGSPAYMSPEQAMERVLDPRSDLFSMGTLLFHLMTGQLPFAGNNPSIILRNIIEGRRPELIDLATDASGAMADIVEQMLSTDPAGRPQNADEIRDAFERTLREVDIAPRQAEWALQGWLTDPEGYQARLDAHLARVLLEKGRDRLAARDHLGALQLFNRLLVLDEENQEVLALVQDMHGMPTGTGRGRRWGLLALALVASTALVTWLLWPTPEPAPTITVEPSPASPIVSPAPLGRPDGGEAAADVGVSDVEPIDAEPAPSAASGNPQQSSAVRPEPDVRILRRPERPSARQIAESSARDAEAVANQALVTVVVPSGWAEIWIDGEDIGITGKVDPIPLSPGSHELRLVNSEAEPYKQIFEVHAGERKDLVVTLQRRPAYVEISEEVRGDCTIWLDSKDIGTVSANVRRVRISEPEHSHEIVFDCPDGARIVRKLQPQGLGKVVKVP